LELSKVLLQHLVDFPHLQVLVFVVLACLLRLLQLFFESKFRHPQHLHFLFTLNVLLANFLELLF
jgi:hypothetical protein